MRRITRLGFFTAGMLSCLSGGANLALGQAAIPAIGSTLPQGVPPGQTVDVKLRGANLVGPTQLWTSFPAEAILPAEIAGNGTNAAEITYRLKVPADAPPGIHALRLANPQGLSDLKLRALDH